MTRPGEEFRDRARGLEAAYLESSDPIEQSGFHGGRERWVAERSPLVGGIDKDGDFLDVGCANGLLPEHSRNFLVADAWTWEPDRQWTFIYSLLDLSPEELWCEWIGRLLSWVEPGGRLIVGSYGSRSRGEPPVDLSRVLEDCGLDVAGWSMGGEGPIARFAWANKS